MCLKVGSYHSRNSVILYQRKIVITDFKPRHFFLQLIAQGNCVSKFKMAAIAIRLSKNEAPKNQVHTGVAEYVKNQVQTGLAEYVKNQTNTGLAEYVGHWKMVSDDIREPEPKLVRLANPPANRLNFDGLDHLIPKVIY